VLAQWLETRYQEIVAISIAYEQEEMEPLADGVAYPLWESALKHIQMALNGQLDRSLASVKIVQQALDEHIDLPTFIRCLNTLRRAVQYVLSQDVYSAGEQLTANGLFNDFLFHICQTASMMMGSGAQAQLLEERHMMRTLLDIMPDLIFAKDRDSKFLLSNRAHANLIGVENPEAMIGKDDFEFFPADDAAHYRQDEQEVINSGQGKIGYEEQTHDAQGNVRWMFATKMPLRDSQGNIMGIAGIVRDITELKLVRERERQQQIVIEAQRQALAELSTPIIPIMDRIIVMPIVGAIDSARSRDVMRSLLEGISQYRAQIAILDITGVPVVDSGVADHLNRTMQAARLKGAQTFITGVSDAVAETIVDLGIDWSGFETLRDLQTGLITALERLGFHLNSSNGKENGNGKKM
jgi:PAS domain S-box-containing protein